MFASDAALKFYENETPISMLAGSTSFRGRRGACVSGDSHALAAWAGSLRSGHSASRPLW